MRFTFSGTVHCGAAPPHRDIFADVLIKPGHDAWASHLSELIAEADAAPFADGTPEEVFGEVKPYIDEALKDEHAERAAAGEGDEERVAAEGGGGGVWRFGEDDGAERGAP